jgi:hypothetical protein
MDINTTYLVPILYEAFVIVIFIFVWSHLFIRWLRKRTNASKKLMITFGMYMFCMFISFWSQFNRNIVNYALSPPEIADTIRNLYLVFVPIANLSYYSFYLEIFESNFQKRKINSLFIGFSMIIIVLALVLIKTPGWEIIGNLLVIVQGFFLYIPSMIATASNFKRIDQSDEGRYAFLALFIMSLFFMLTWLSFLFNSIWDFVTQTRYGPIFYFAWSFILIAQISGYIGFVFPASFRAFMKKRIEKQQ